MSVGGREQSRSSSLMQPRLFWMSRAANSSLQRRASSRSGDYIALTCRRVVEGGEIAPKLTPVERGCNGGNTERGNGEIAF